MQRIRLLPLALLSVAVFATSCKTDTGSNPTDAGTGGGGTADTGTNDPADSGPMADAGCSGNSDCDGNFICNESNGVCEEPPCVRDQDCPSGMVCDLSVSPRQCVMGKACTTDPDCSRCYDLTGQNQEECGHGFHVRAFCNANHGNVCTRELGPCEPCSGANEAGDRECGTLHPSLGGRVNKCIEYDSGGTFCGRANTAGCPRGFISNADSQCVRQGSCPAQTRVCPAMIQGQMCTGTDQICAGDECPMTGGARCSGNEVPGALGLCVNFCTQNSDCPADLPICNKDNGICIAGCTKDSCSNNEVCHLDGFCAEPCDSNDNCVMRFDGDAYCNSGVQPPPNTFKAYHDTDSCQSKGCERPVDCPSAGLVCDKMQMPYPACVPGCFDDTDCLSGEQCKNPGAAGPQPSYDRRACRALQRNAEDGTLGVCCNPGCTNRNLQCGFNQWCCGETGSPYESTSSCLTLSSTGGPSAEGGQCFDIQPPPASPWCKQCQANSDCNSAFTFGFNTDPSINNGQPFQEQEWCRQVAMGLGMCNVTCNPALPEGGNIGCPRLWSCQPFSPPCFQDADCSGLPCTRSDGQTPNPNSDPPLPGQCQCGASGQVNAQCPTVYPNLDAVTNPRCLELGQNGEMYCIASYNCEPPQLTQDAMMRPNYPSACLQ